MERFDSRQRLLIAMAEQLKLPLLQIARTAEQAGTSPSFQQSNTISSTADIALRMIDGYLLSILPVQDQLPLEPILVSAVLQDTAHRLSKVASDYNCQIEVSISGRQAPVMANRKNIEIAYTLLLYAFIQAQENPVTIQRVLLATHKTPNGLEAGIFGDQKGINNEMLRRARALCGSARQPLPFMSSSGGAGVFIADNLLQAMNAPLHIAKHQKLNGLAATLLFSYQLQFTKL